MNIMPEEDIARRFFDAYRNSTRPVGLRVFIIGENHILRIIDGRFSWSEYGSSYGYTRIDGIDRGKILNVFSKLEFLINECINLYFLNALSGKKEDLAFIIKKLPFRQRIEAIRNFGIVNSSLEKKLKMLSSTRNVLAHEWDKNAAKYCGEYLTEKENFKKFQRALTSAFEKLVEEYKKLQSQKDYLEYLNFIISGLKKNT